MDSLKAGFKKISSLLEGKTSYYLTIVGLFVYHMVFDEQLTCLSKRGVKPDDWPTKRQCDIYIAMPPFILFFLILWLDGEFQQVWTIVYRCGSDFWKRLFSALFKAVVIGSLWVVSVLLDGDWYVCHYREQLLGSNETSIYTKDELRRNSVVIGLAATLGLVFLVATFNAIPCWCYHCRCSKNAKDRGTEDEERQLDTENKKCCLTCCNTFCRSYHRILFEETVLIEMEKIIQRDLKRTATEFGVHKGRELLQPASTLSPEEMKDRVINVDNLHFDKINNLQLNILESVSELCQQTNQTSRASARAHNVNKLDEGQGKAGTSSDRTTQNPSKMATDPNELKSLLEMKDFTP